MDRLGMCQYFVTWVSRGVIRRRLEGAVDVMVGISVELTLATATRRGCSSTGVYAKRLCCALSMLRLRNAR